MAAPRDPDYRDHLQALADRFGASVPARMEAIAGALAAAGMAPGREQLEAVQQALHTVAGSAGSFGFTVLGEEARRLEQAVRPLLAGEPGWPELVPRIQAYLAWASHDPKSVTYPTHD
ncbi:Hpt domain-containing protein [Massilia sp. METH4]|uniref:Hpt domain-containing protein n=1 Tax=Massilia sp. METH4 TaxID=3123041 RepID=UPI0030D0B6A7